MTYIFVYLIGAAIGLLIWCVQYIYKKSNEHKKVIVEAYNKRSLCDDASKISISPISNMPMLYCGPVIVRFVAFVVFIVLIIGTFLNAKYDLWVRVKPVIANIINMAKPVVTFVLGLCSPYLSERVTKKLKKARKKIKKKKKKK